MNKWLANILGGVDYLHVEVDMHKCILVGYCFIRN
jgi:hypothetical protein